MLYLIMMDELIFRCLTPQFGVLDGDRPKAVYSRRITSSWAVHIGKHTESDLYIRKSEIPQVVIWVFIAFAGGFIARFGELAADKAIHSTKEFYKKLNDRFSKFLQINPAKPDVIFGIEIPDSSVAVEGALEQASKEILEIVWQKLPEIYAIATHLIRQNPKGYFSQIKFLFNPQSKKWEINYLTLRKSGRIIQGPRYYEPNHPLRERWEREIERIVKESGK